MLDMLFKLFELLKRFKEQPHLSAYKNEVINNQYAFEYQLNCTSVRWIELITLIAFVKIIITMIF